VQRWHSLEGLPGRLHRRCLAEEQTHLTKAFEDGMRELGYVKVATSCSSGDSPTATGRLPELAADLVKRNPT